MVSAGEHMRSKVRMSMIDSLPPELRVLFNDFDQANVLDCMAMAGSKDPVVVRRLLERDLRLRQEAVLRGDDPAFARETTH